MNKKHPHLFKAMHRVIAAGLLLLFVNNSFAWSADGHSAIGILAMKQLLPEARVQLQQAVGSLVDADLVKACNWPDDVRKTDEWEWSAPQHYINLPREDDTYQKERDCNDGLCATEAIKKYAGQVFDQSLDDEQRWQAFAWLCHVTGDLHQPMHAAFADDRGGNNHDVVFRDLEINLHGFWDHEVIGEFAGGVPELVALLSTGPQVTAGADWRAGDVDAWTGESHRLAMDEAYPQTRHIDRQFALQSWLLVQQQISLAAKRLALIINTEFERAGD